MLLRTIPLVLTCSVLAACTTMSETTPTGPNTYRVTYNAGAKWQTWVEVKNIARDQAKAHCAALGQRMSRPNVSSNKATGLMPKEATVDFECVAITEDANAAGDRS